MLKNILNDDRDIQSIHYNNRDDDFHSVGSKGSFTYRDKAKCTKIEPYLEEDESIWVAVYYNNEIRLRVPAYKVEIFYGSNNNSNKTKSS